MPSGVYKRTSQHLRAMSRVRSGKYRGKPAMTLAQRKEANKKSSGKYNDRIYRMVYEAYGNKCSCCGESEPKFLSLDHVNGGGTQERKTKGGPVAPYRIAIQENFPATYRLLCYNCNQGRERNGGICPHKQ